MARKGRKYPGVYTITGKKGTSYGIDYVHPQTGLRVRKIVESATSEAAAYEIRSIEIADAKRNIKNTLYSIKDQGKPVSFKTMVEAYLKWAKENKDSWATDEHRAKPLLKAYQAKLMSDINPFVVEKYKMARVKDVDKKTVNKELSFGSQVFEKAIEWKKFNGENPFLKAGRFKVKRGKKPGALTPDEVTSIMNAIDHPVKRSMVAFAFYTGWRISEIRKLKWEDVNLQQGTAWIVDPKNGQSVNIELGAMAQEILSRQEKRSEHVFCHMNGKAFKTNLHKVITNAAEKAGVTLPPRKAWHIFRRTWASMMLQNGCDVETLRVLGNWKDCGMPLWYAEAAGAEAKRAALDKIPELKAEDANDRKMAEIEEANEAS